LAVARAVREQGLIVVGVVVLVASVVLFFVPVVETSHAQSLTGISCQPNSGCRPSLCCINFIPHNGTQVFYGYESLTYWAFGSGGTFGPTKELFTSNGTKLTTTFSTDPSYFINYAHW
jgi:hypothetical protein